MKLIGPSIRRAPECEAVLRSLPQWFGIEDALQMYVRDSENLPTFALEEAGQLVAFLSLREHFPQAWEVHCIAVSASHRGMGLGSRLLGHAEDWLASQGVRFLQIKTISGTSSDPNYAETRQFYFARGLYSARGVPTAMASLESGRSSHQGTLRSLSSAARFGESPAPHRRRRETTEREPR